MEVYELVVNLVKACGKREFVNDHRKLGRFFYNASLASETAALFEDVLFNDSLGYPSSNKLDEVFRDMQLTGIIGRPNPMYMTNTINLSPVNVDDLHFKSESEMPQFKQLLTMFTCELCRNE